MGILVHRRSGLVEPFDPPELTIEASIDRSTVMDGLLLVPRQPEYLRTKPGFWEAIDALPQPWGWGPARIPWEPGPFITGLPEL